MVRRVLAAAKCSSPTLIAEAERLESLMDDSVAALNAQRVCFLTLSMVSCTLVPELAGSRVKVKGRWSKTTLMKSAVHLAPADGGRLGIDESCVEAVYEGDDVLRFEICRAHTLLPSTVLGTGSLELATVFGGVGLDGVVGSWLVPLVATGGQLLGSLEVSLSCGAWSLGEHGGAAALKVLALPRRPRVCPLALGGFNGRALAQAVAKYCDSCCEATWALQAAFKVAAALAATSAAGVRAGTPPPAAQRLRHPAAPAPAATRHHAASRTAAAPVEAASRQPLCTIPERACE